MNKIISAAHQAQKELNSLDNNLSKEIEYNRKKGWQHINEISDKIQALEAKKHRVQNRMDKRDSRIKKRYEKLMSTLHEPIQRLERIIQLIDLMNRSEVPDLKTVVDNSGYAQTAFVVNLHKDKYLNLNVYVTETRKPKNKFSLYLIGNSFFPRTDDGLVKYQYDYGCDIRFKQNSPNIIIALRQAPTKEELIKWAFDNKEKILTLTGFPTEQHNDTVREYEWVVENCQTKEWRKAYLLSEKKYYENRVSRGEESEEYKAIVKQLASL